MLEVLHGDQTRSPHRSLARTRRLYWQDDDGHLWEILTISYARAAS
ncbi:MAG TPA: hypothetical protein VGQ77_08520 [Methylomirabilota bacterium]|jgi:hypothetical protein|nr:hypothetical protein [Methylomirabilota bacterium]